MFRLGQDGLVFFSFVLFSFVRLPCGFLLFPLQNTQTFSPPGPSQESADINAARVNPFVTVVQDTVLTVSVEQLGVDGRLYLELPELGGWLWDDTPLDPGRMGKKKSFSRLAKASKKRKDAEIKETKSLLFPSSQSKQN